MKLTSSLRWFIVPGVILGCVLPVLAEGRGGRGGGLPAAGGPGDQAGVRDGFDERREDADLWRSLRALTRLDPVDAPAGTQGDLWPTIAESEVAPDRPWVIWSRFNGEDYDLAWSRWAGPGWQAPEWVDGSTLIEAGDDLDADVDFDRGGRPMIVWWRDRGGRGRVFWSTFLQSRWLEPVPISRVPLDARSPSIEVLSVDTVLVRYETPAGTVRHTLRYVPPVTITDDLNPLDFRFTTDTFVVEPRKE